MTHEEFVAALLMLGFNTDAYVERICLYNLAIGPNKEMRFVSVRPTRITVDLGDVNAPCYTCKGGKKFGDIHKPCTERDRDRALEFVVGCITKCFRVQR